MPIGPPVDVARPVVVLPAVAALACDDPAAHLADGGTVGHDAMSVTALGDALIDCDRRRALAVDAARRAGAQ